ncbi:phosphoglycerate dehydrogenase [Aeromicrobium sp.]
MLIATRTFGSTSREPWDILTAAGCDHALLDIRTASDAELTDALGRVDAAIVGGRPITASMIEASERLKVIAMHGVGVDHIDRAAAKAKGIVVANAPGANASSVADLAIGLMLAVARRIPQESLELQHGHWTSSVGTELWQKTLGLVGLGQIGRGVAQRAHGFEMNVLGYDPYVTDADVEELGIHPVELDELLAGSDIVSLHAPATPETRNLISAERLVAMKSTAILINTARGDLVDESALREALTNGVIAGAGLDAHVHEPPLDDSLVSLPNVVATPHIGAHTAEAVTRASVMAAQNVVAVLSGGPARWPV